MPHGANLKAVRHSWLPPFCRPRRRFPGRRVRRGKEKRDLNSVASQLPANDWLIENGPKELELLFRTFIRPTPAPVLIADDDGHCHDASASAAKLLGFSREEIITRQIDNLRLAGENAGKLGFLGVNASAQDLRYVAKANILPKRHLLALRDKTEQTPSWAEDYALYLQDTEGRIAAWYGGAERIYGYTSGEVVGQPSALLYHSETALRKNLRDQLHRAATEGHTGAEGWQVKKNGSRFWANVIVVALKDESGGLMGSGMVFWQCVFSTKQPTQTLKNGFPVLPGNGPRGITAVLQRPSAVNLS